MEARKPFKEHLTARNGWLVMALGIVAFEAACPKGETLSEGVDRGMERSPLTKAAIVGSGLITLGHLVNVIPEKYDPFHYALFWKEHDGEPRT